MIPEIEVSQIQVDQVHINVEREEPGENETYGSSSGCIIT